MGFGIARSIGSWINPGCVLSGRDCIQCGCFLAKARVALSVSLTLCSTLLAVLLTPWLTYFYAGHYVPIDQLH